MGSATMAEPPDRAAGAVPGSRRAATSRTAKRARPTRPAAPTSALVTPPPLGLQRGQVGRRVGREEDAQAEGVAELRGGEACLEVLPETVDAEAAGGVPDRDVVEQDHAAPRHRAGPGLVVVA